MSILKLQSGGGAPPFTSYTPVTVNAAPTTVQTTSTTKSSSDDSTKGEITDKDLLSMLKEIDGLPSDMNSVFNKVEQLYSAQNLLGANTNVLNTKYVNILRQVKNIKYGKEEYDIAKKQIMETGGLNEVAINEEGKIAVKDSKNNITTVTLDTYQKNKDSYIPLSNSELLNLRAYKYAGDSSIVQMVANGTGMKAINTYISGALSNLETSSTTTEGYTKITKTPKVAIEGSKILQELASKGYDLTGGLEGLYKTKVISESQKSQIESALAHIYTTMPNNMKTLLTFKAGSEENAKKLIQAYALKGDSEKTSMSIDREKDETTSSASEMNKIHDNIFTNIIRGKGGTKGTYMLRDSDGRTLQVNGSIYNQFDEKHQLMQGSISQLMGELGPGIYKGGNYAVTFGNKVLSTSDMSQMSFVNDGKSIRTILPITKDKNGNIVPDLNFMETHKNLLDKINTGSVSKQKLMQAGLIDPRTGELDTNKFAPFLLVNGYGTSRNVEDNNFITEVKGDQLESKIQQFEQSVYRDKKDGDQGRQFKFDFDQENLLNPLDWFGNYDKLYEGTIFIPITQNINQGMSASTEDTNWGQSDTIEQKYQEFEAQKSLNNSSSNLLGI